MVRSGADDLFLAIMAKKKSQNPQKYPKCPLCRREQDQFPPDLFGPCRVCIDNIPEAVKEWRAKHKKGSKEVLPERQ